MREGEGEGEGGRGGGKEGGKENSQSEHGGDISLLCVTLPVPVTSTS